MSTTDLPAQRGELQRPGRVDPRSSVKFGAGLADRAPPCREPLRELPDEQREQQDDEPDRQCLRAELQPCCGHLTAATMKTGVPTVTWLKSHSASGMCIRMQPCEAE